MCRKTTGVLSALKGEEVRAAPREAISCTTTITTIFCPSKAEGSREEEEDFVRNHQSRRGNKRHHHRRDSEGTPTPQGLLRCSAAVTRPIPLPSCLSLSYAHIRLDHVHPHHHLTPAILSVSICNICHLLLCNRRFPVKFITRGVGGVYLLAKTKVSLSGQVNLG